MYAKNLPVPPKFDYPYQEQQRYSGSLIVSTGQKPTKELAADTLAKLEETARQLSSAKK